MICNRCGQVNEPGSRFCERCGAPIELAYTPGYPAPSPAPVNAPGAETGRVPSPQPPKREPGERKKKNVAAILLGALNLLLAVIIALMATGVADAVFTTQQPAFKEPEDAIQYFMSCVKQGDYDGALAACSIEQIAQNYDFEAMTDRMQAISPVMQCLPSEYDMYEAYNEDSMEYSIMRQLSFMAMSVSLPEEYSGIFEGYSLYEGDIDLDDAVKDMDTERFHNIEIIKIGTSKMLDEGTYQDYLEEQADFCGADEATCRVVLFQVDGDYYAGGFMLLKYGDSWLISMLNDATIGQTTYGALIPLDSKSDFDDMLGGGYTAPEEPETTAAAAPSETVAGAEATEAPAAMKIAYFVTDMRNTFHQAQAAEAQRYAAETYGAEVVIFDGKGDSNIMTANIDQIVAQGMNMATLHIWDNAAAMPGIQAALDEGVVMASFFSPIPDAGIPEVRNDEAGVSEQMGKEMAEQWKAANPDTPIVMAELGWPNNEDVITGRTDPFVAGVKSVDPTATDLGCFDASGGSDAAKQIMKDLCTQHPEVNLIYAESGGLAVGVMAALNEAGRGTVADDGKPTTELVCSCDFDEVQLKEMFDSNSSLKESLALPPIETGDTRINVLFDILNGDVPQISDTVPVCLAKAFIMSYYSTTRADGVEWLNNQFGLSLS